MRYPMYAIKDNKVAFQLPICDMNDSSAVRNFAFGVNNSDGVMSFSPVDYDLYKVGYFDSEKGCVESLEVPEFIVSGSSVYGAKE